MLVVAGSIQHESNTFCPAQCVYGDFDRFYDGEVLSKIAPTDYFKARGVEIHPTVYANSVPSGAVDRKSFDRLLNELTGRIPRGRHVNGVWLYCHGAMHVDGLGSGDAAIVAAVRQAVGAQVPIAVALDFHANNTAEIIREANIVCGYRTAPHTDMAETQLRAARLLAECIDRGELPRPALVTVPVIVTGDMVITAAEPMRSIVDECIRLEREEGILSASVFNGQPWIDAANTCASAVVVARNDTFLQKAGHCAARLGSMLWDAKDKYRFQVDAMGAGDAVRAAMRQGPRPVYIADSGDNTTAGALGRSAFLLSELIANHAESALLAGITCPEAVEACERSSPGDRVSVRLGDEPERPLILDAVFRNRSKIAGWDGEDASDCAVLSVPGIDIIVTARPCAVISPEIIESSGVRLADYGIVAVKQGYLFPKLAAVASRAILALTPGVSCEDIGAIPYRHIRRPSWPMDKGFAWEPERLDCDI
jgi:microcystin degradation protein MlrC